MVKYKFITPKTIERDMADKSTIEAMFVSVLMMDPDLITRKVVIVK